MSLHRYNSINNAIKNIAAEGSPTTRADTVIGVEDLCVSLLNYSGLRGFGETVLNHSKPFAGVYQVVRVLRAEHSIDKADSSHRWEVIVNKVHTLLTHCQVTEKAPLDELYCDIAGILVGCHSHSSS